MLSQWQTAEPAAGQLLADGPDGRSAGPPGSRRSRDRKGRAKLSSWPSGSVRWKKRSPHSASRGAVLGWHPAARALVERVDVGDVEDHAAPPAPALLRGAGGQVEVAAPGPEAGEGRGFAAGHDLEPQRTVEADRPRHVVGGQRDRTDALDHRQNPPARTMMARCRPVPATRRRRAQEAGRSRSYVAPPLADLPAAMPPGPRGTDGRAEARSVTRRG